MNHEKLSFLPTQSDDVLDFVSRRIFHVGATVLLFVLREPPLLSASRTFHLPPSSHKVAPSRVSKPEDVHGC